MRRSSRNPRIGVSMGNDPLGWMITVQLPYGGAPQIYNIAIPDERQAIDAVKQVLPEAKGTIVKVKSELLERVYKALKMRPGDVLVGGRRPDG
jgi:hypothetical protein